MAETTNLLNALEPDAVAAAGEKGSAEEKMAAASVISIAISLKRIADAFETTNEYGEHGSAAISGSILRGLRS